MRCTIGRVLSLTGRVEVVGYAHNGIEGVEKAREFKPDLVTLDIEMPEMDGLKALPRIKHACGAKVLMVSSLTQEGTASTLTALRLGAADFIGKDQSQITRNLDGMTSELAAKVEALFPARPEPAKPAATPAPTSQSTHKLPDLRHIELIAIGASTGGPPVLEQLIESLPADFPAPVVIAQHMPAMFTKSMAQRLNEMARVKVLHVDQMLPVRPGHVYLGVGGRHIVLTRRRGDLLWVDSQDQPADALYKPSVNELFRTAAACCKARCLGIVLTGMGEDGVIGAHDLHAAGAPIIAQDAESCVVYGMPRAVVDAGLCTAQLTPSNLTRVLTDAGAASRRLVTSD